MRLAIAGLSFTKTDGNGDTVVLPHTRAQLRSAAWSTRRRGDVRPVYVRHHGRTTTAQP